MDELWYVSHAEEVQGPWIRSQVVERLRLGTLSWTAVGWTPAGTQDWRRIHDIPEFRPFLPPIPPAERLRAAQAAAAPGRPSGPIAALVEAGPGGRWFLQFDGSEYGPFSQGEIRVVLESGKVRGDLYVWREGMESWVPIQEVPELVQWLQRSRAGGPAGGKAPDGRAAERFALIATVSVIYENIRLVLGVCRDISATGMQILTNHQPGPVGTMLSLSVTPGGGTGLKPFTVDAEVVRFLEDAQGFCVKFDNLSTQAREALAQYLKQARPG